MYIKYEIEEENGYVREFEYEVDYRTVNNLLIKLLCEDLKDRMGKMYSEDGAYQMADFVVSNLECDEQLTYYYQDEIKEHFERDAYEEYYGEND